MRNSSSRWRKWETTDLSDAVPLCEHQLGDGVQGNDSQDEGRECEAQQVGPWREDVGLVVRQKLEAGHLNNDKGLHTMQVACVRWWCTCCEWVRGQGWGECGMGVEEGMFVWWY